MKTMKIFGRYIVCPINIRKSSTHFGDKPDITIRWRKNKYNGTMRVTLWTLQVITHKKERQFSFVWRPDVTRHWWADMEWRKEIKAKW